MTREEAVKLLSNTKVYVKDKSEEIQKKLFDIGFKWDNEPSQTVAFTDKPFLFLYELSEITHSSNVNWFYNHTNKEVTPEDILSITIDEPKYRPFKNKEECWNEMLKHQPFGWIICDEIYRNLIEISDYSVIFINDDKEIDSPFPASLINIKFTDGTPFGIKEE